MRGWTIAFDLDGTLVDTAPDLIGSANHTLGAVGLQAVPADVLRPYISLGARELIVVGLRQHGQVREAAEIDRLLAVFLEHYGRNIAVESRPFPLLRETLAAFRDGGARLVVCTNKREALARQLLDALDLSHAFAAITGRDTFPVCKPHPDHLLGAIAAGGGVRTRAIMIGDSDVDIDTAKAAGVPVVAVTFGYTSVPVTDLAPDAVIDHYRELPSVIARLVAAA